MLKGSVARFLFPKRSLRSPNPHDSAAQKRATGGLKPACVSKLRCLLSAVGVGFGPVKPSSRKKRKEEEFLERWVPYEEHVRELAVLKLLGRPYSPEDYLTALERHLKVSIKIKDVYEVIRGSAQATMRYSPETCTVVIYVPERLSWWLRRYALFHELAHLAAAHPFMERLPQTGEVIRVREPDWRRLASKAPITGESIPEDLPEAYRNDLHRLHEDEADLRTQHHMLTAQLGARALEVEGLNQF